MKIEEIQFNVDNETLRGVLYKAENPKTIAVLFLHGWTGKENRRAAEVLVYSDFSCMTFSLSGHGDSSGKIADHTRAKSLKEVISAYDYFKSKLPEGTRICAAGASYGCYMAVLLSGERSISALSLRVPANYEDSKFDMPQMGQGADNRAVVEWRKLKLDSQATRSLRQLRTFKGPVQIIEAENDERLTHQAVQNYVDAISDKTKLDYHFMQGWPHSLGDDPQRNQQYQEMLLTWLRFQVSRI